ncbi:hypothetical protein FACS189459_4020 [Bacilli bacterium]|nr:hypothetical protein FACS189459_4020 [Bacilli bacterium]
MCARTTVAKPNCAPSAIHVAEKSITRLIPVIASGVTMEKLEVIITALVLNGLECHIPKHVIVPINNVTGTTIIVSNKVLSNALTKSSFWKSKK